MRRADEQNAIAHYKFGRLYEVDDFDRALLHYKKAVIYGFQYALYNIDVLWGNAGNIAKAETYYEKAAAQGIAMAFYRIGFIHEDYDDDDYDDPKIAKKCYKQAAAQGYRKAHYSLGFIYEEEKKIDAAIECYVQAAYMANHQNAIMRLVLYASNEFEAFANIYGSYQSDVLAVIERRRGRKREVLCKIAKVAYNTGKVEIAWKFYYSAMTQGSIKAIFELGNICYTYERLDSAKYFYELAGDRGHKVSQQKFNEIMHTEGKPPKYSQTS